MKKADLATGAFPGGTVAVYLEPGPGGAEVVYAPVAHKGRG